MAKVIFSDTDINEILKALNLLSLRGVENAKFIAFIDQKLREGEIKEEEE